MPVLSALGSLGDPQRTVTVKHISVCRLQLTRVEFKIEFTNIGRHHIMMTQVQMMQAPARYDNGYLPVLPRLMISSRTLYVSLRIICICDLKRGFGPVRLSGSRANKYAR